jgi:hypothetical protein
MASEIFDKATKAEKLPKVLASLADRPMRKKPSGGAAHVPASTGGSGFADMPDDIPF